MTLPEFHNALRILLNLDCHDLAAARILQATDAAAWERFQHDPFRFFLRADDTTTDRLWALIQSRQPPEGDGPSLGVSSTLRSVHADTA